MNRPIVMGLLALLCSVAASGVFGEETPIPQAWDYALAMREVAAMGTSRAGVVLHVGDSITYANPYGQWARAGLGRTPEDLAALAWMHAGADDDGDGWWLARVDHSDGGRSSTAAGGLRADELLSGGRNGLPPLGNLLERFRPRVIVLMVGTNDASEGRDVPSYRADIARAVDLSLGRGVVVILSTIPPHPARRALAASYNEALRSLARSRGLPLIDFEREILARRPDDWDGTLLGRGDVHPSADQGGVTPTSAPTAANLRESGYLLRGWLSVRKVAEVKRKVFEDPAPVAVAATTEGPTAARPGPDETLKLPVTRDAWFSNVGTEADGNNGGASRLKIKSYQEMSLIDINPAPLRGRAIRSATLHLWSTGEPRLLRVTVGSFGAEWVEGTASGYALEAGSSTFKHRRHPGVPWTVPGSDLCSVILGQGGTTWRMADASPPDAKGWQRIAVDPTVLAARVAGVSHGLFLFDDTGSEWTRRGESFTPRPMPNRFVSSRESNGSSAPYLTVAPGPRDDAPPAVPGGLASDPADLPHGEAWVSWTTPTDVGPAGTVGFFAKVDGKELPRYLIPLAGKAGERVRMHLRDLGLAPGAVVRLAVVAVDAAGNIGPEATTTVRVSTRVAAPLPGADPAPFQGRGPLPKLGGSDVAVVDEFDKMQPVTGELIPPQPSGYFAANHLWDATSRRVRLHAARNEFVGFQVIVRGGVAGVRPTLTFGGANGPAIRGEFGLYRHVASRKGPLPDPIVPLGGPSAIEVIPDRMSGSLYCEVFVPHGAGAGEHRGTLTLESGGKTLALDVSLTVWDFTLPDSLSFLPEMNCYGLPAGEAGYYRLAHRHRTFLNRVPYSQAGHVAEGCAPAWDGKTLDWTAWDRRFGPYLDGSAFADLPRKGVPVDGFYLPLHENWPDPVEGNYDGGYWADRAFSARHRRDFVEVSRQISEHVNAKGWDGTLFQCFLNNKSDFKAKGWSRGSSPWLLDEPAAFQDFWALRHFGIAFHEGIRQIPGRAKLLFRCDISRPQWQRDSLDGLLDYDVVGAAMRPYHRIVFDRKATDGQLVVEYGGTNAIEEANVQPVGWCLDSWSLGSDGVLPWQTVGTADSWTRADPLALFYPGWDGNNATPTPSIRLKAYRRGQQDVEYLTILSQVSGQPRWAIGNRVREALRLSGERKASGTAAIEDAGLIDFARLSPQALWAFRVRVGRALSEAHPAPRRRLFDLRTPPRDLSRLAPGHASTTGGAARPE